MGLITERNGADDGYEEVSSGVILRRRSALPSRRAVLYVHGQRDTFVPEDLVAWYTERGFHFYVADLRPPDRLDKPRRRRRKSPRLRECLDRLDAACRHLRDAEGIDMLMVSAHARDALTAALWCDQRHQAGRPDVLVLSSPAFGRRLRRGLEIACPVLVLSLGSDPKCGRRAARRHRKYGAAIRLGPHVTWLRDVDQQRFFDELGRWLGAYMYGKVRDQLL